MNIKMMLFIVISSLTVCFAQTNYIDTSKIIVSFSADIDTTSIHPNQWVLVNVDSMTQVPFYGWSTRWTEYNNDTICRIGNPDLNHIDTVVVVGGRMYASTLYRLYVYGVIGKNGVPMIEDSIHNFAELFTDSNLPVELSVFTATQNNYFINLYWKTETEVNNYGFEIERKYIYEKTWTKIDFVAGNGNSNSPKEYNYVDDLSSVSSVEVVYRLKQIDTDGQYKYSHSILIYYASTIKDFALELYPNPFNSMITLLMNVPMRNNIEISIYTVLGEQIFNNTFENIVGKYELTLNMNNISSGTYFFVARSGDYVNIKKGILLK